MKSSEFQQSGFLTRFNLRRDWFVIFVWGMILAILMGAVAFKFNDLYGTKSAISSIVTTLKMPAMVSLFGSFVAQPPYSTADIFASEMMVFMALCMAAMNIYFAVRNTRGEESNGMVELIRSRAVGKQSPLLAAILELLLINLVIGGLYVGGLQVSGMHGTSAVGNLLIGSGLAAVGFMFGSAALLMAQISDNARGATMLSYLFLGITYLIRMITDVQNDNYTWWSPFGWVEKLSIYHQNHWAPVGFMLALSLGLLLLTFFANRHRDVGAGLLVTRKGRYHASPLLAGPFSLVLRLDRVSLLVWVISCLILGISYGSIFGTVGDLMKTNPFLGKLMGATAVNAANQAIVLRFAALLMIVFTVLVTVPSVQTLLRINGDERKGWLEQLHAKSVSRLHLFSSYVGVAILIGTLALFSTVFGLWLANEAVMDNPLTFSRVFRGFLGYLPALYVTLGISIVLVGWLPRWQTISWVIPVYGLISLYFGNLLNIPDWAQKLTPYGWINQVPVKTVDWTQVVVFLGLAVVLFFIGFMGYKNRDLIEN
ncbi:ABC transporter permease [Pediococcus siamensis]|uniref:ABC transporter permease n=1 Tax=Pediococcus siamensis TaxID=381829 RepID=UPI0039A08142